MENTTLIIKYTENELSAQEKERFEKELKKKPELMYEYNLHVHLNSFMKGKFMSEHVEHDIYLDDANKFAKEAIKDSFFDNEQDDILDFLNKGKYVEAGFDEDIRQIEDELSRKKIDLITGQWVEDWNEIGKDTEYFNELKAFVANGMEQNGEQGQEKVALKVIRSEEIHNVRTINKWIYAVAAVAAVFIISIGLWTQFDAPVNNSDLFAANYQPYKIISKQLRGEANDESNLNKATALYKSQQYEKALLLLKDINTEDKNAEIPFLYALTLIENGSYNEAITEFNNIILKFDNYQIESKWYLALCYLKTNKTNKSVVLLKELSLTKNYYRSRAVKILNELD